MGLAIIPARGGSKRIKNKNIIEFCGKPLISYSLEAVKQSGIFDHIHVSTDSLEVRQVVENLGFPVAFMRPSHLADDQTGLIPVLQWVLKEFKEQDRHYDEVGLILPTAPLIEASDLNAAYEVFRKSEKKHPLMSCGKYPVPIEWAFNLNEQGLLKAKDEKGLNVRSQDMPAAYYDSGAFSFLTADHLENGFAPIFTPYILSRDKAIDIDDLSDLRLAEIMYLGRKEKRLLCEKSNSF